MKRSPVLLLSLAILSVCLWFAGAQSNVSVAAPDRAIPWWFGDEDYFYSEHECTDGMALWITNTQGPKVRVVAEQVLGGSVLVDETFTMVSNHPDGAYKYYGAFTLVWPQQLQPGSKIRLKIDTFKNNPNGFNYYEINLWIEDCKLPQNPQPSEIVTIFEGATPSTEVNRCETREFTIEPYDSDYENILDLVIADLDVAFFIASAPAAHVSATLESPSGTRVQLTDRNHKASFRLGTTCSDYDMPLPDFVFDDDSAFSLENANRPFNQTSFPPFPDLLSAFNGELANGTWKIELCNIEAPVSEQVVVGQNGNFEQGSTGWTITSTTGRDLIYNQSTPDVPISPRSGQWLAWLGENNNEVSRIKQVIRPPSSLRGFMPVLQFWYQIKSSEDGCSYEDSAYVIMNGEVLDDFNLCSSTATSTWTMHEIDLQNKGDWYYLEESVFEIEVETDESLPSSFFLDDIGWRFEQPGSEVACMLMDFEADDQSPSNSADIFAYGRSSAGDAIWFGTGNTDAHFFQKQWNAVENGNYYQLVAGNFNDDDLTDIVAYGRGANPDAVWFSTGNSQPPYFQKNFGFRDDGSYDILVGGDFNGDGLTDVVAYGRGTSADAIWFVTGNTQAPFFNKQYGFRDNGSYDILAAGDFNGDGLSDVVAYGRGTNPDAIWFATGNTQAPFFNKQYGFRDNGAYDSLAAGDFNGDGLADVVAYGRGTKPDAIWFATGNTQAPFFNKQYGFRDDGTYDSLAAGDFNGDGLTDVVAFARGTNPDSIWFATGSTQAPFFQKNYGFKDSGLYDQLVVGNFNGD